MAHRVKEMNGFICFDSTDPIRVEGYGVGGVHTTFRPSVHNDVPYLTVAIVQHDPGMRRSFTFSLADCGDVEVEADEYNDSDGQLCQRAEMWLERGVEMKITRRRRITKQGELKTHTQYHYLSINIADAKPETYRWGEAAYEDMDAHNRAFINFLMHDKCAASFEVFVVWPDTTANPNVGKFVAACNATTAAKELESEDDDEGTAAAVDPKVSIYDALLRMAAKRDESEEDENDDDGEAAAPAADSTVIDLTGEDDDEQTNSTTSPPQPVISQGAGSPPKRAREGTHDVDSEGKKTKRSISPASAQRELRDEALHIGEALLTHCRNAEFDADGLKKWAKGLVDQGTALLNAVAASEAEGAGT